MRKGDVISQFPGNTLNKMVMALQKSIASDDVIIFLYDCESRKIFRVPGVALLVYKLNDSTFIV